MTVLFRCRIQKPLLDKADRVTNRLGTSTAEMVRVFVAQIARTGRVPLSLAPGSEGLLDKEHRNRLLKDLDDSEGW